jgi:alpha-methylacyl-CoA racemase
MVCAIEARFFRILLDGLQLDTIDPAAQHDRSKWADHIALFDEIFATRTRAEWSETFAGTDACVSPVLSIGEAPDHPHNVARGTFVESDGVRQPGPAPRFSRTRSEIRGTADIGPVTVGDILERWNLDDAGIDYE